MVLLKEKLVAEDLAGERAKAQLLEDELYAQSTEEYRDTGSLSSASLCEKTLEYEGCLLTISRLEQQLREIQKKAAE